MRKIILFVALCVSFAFVNAQNVSTYTFTQFTGTYTAITGGTTILAGGSDNVFSALTNIGFNFVYHGAVFTQFCVNSNGFITLGVIPTADNAQQYNPLPNIPNTIAFAAKDDNTDSPVEYVLTGSFPNRILTIQYTLLSLYYDPGFTDQLRAQVKLYESSNIIELIYQTVKQKTDNTVRVGITGAAVTDFSVRSNASKTWATTVAGLTNAATMAWKGTATTNVPANGQTYRWSPCTTPGTPASLTGTSTGKTTATISWTAGTPAGSATVTYYYEVFKGATSVANGNTTSTSAAITGLTCETAYTFKVYAKTSCDNSQSSTATSASFTTDVCSCTTPGTPATATATVTGQETADLSWTAGSPAGSATVTYYWEVLEGATVRQSGSTTGTSASVTGLVCNTIYTFTVYAKTSCDNSQSTVQTSATFKTNACSACATPDTPATATVSSPGLTTATLAWTAGPTAGSASVTYYWAVGTANTVTYDADYTSRGSTTSLTDAVSGLTCGTTYYLAVKAYTSCDATSSGYKVSSSPFSTLSCALDPCANATPLVCGAVASSATLNPTGGVWNSYPGSGITYTGSEKVWSFTPTNSGSHTFTLSGSADFFLMSSCSNTSTNLAGGRWGAGNKSINLVAGTTYYLIADFKPENQDEYMPVSARITCPTTDINMSNGTTNVYCGTTYSFYDSGGSGGNYGNDQNYTYTFTSSNGNPLKMTFSAFNTQATNDKMTIFDGVGTGGAVLLNGHSGITNPGVINSTSTSLTVVFTSDGGTVAAGWAATVTCAVLDVVYGSPNCGSAVPFCATNDNPGVNFGITSDISNAPAGQCSYMKNPTWWYMKIEQAGDIDITIASSCGDVDFACYGPFTGTLCTAGDLTNSATSNYYPGAADAAKYSEAGGSSDSGTPFCREGTLKGTSGKLVDFGGSTSQVEYLQIRNTVVGDYYMVLIGNFSHCAGTVSFTQTNLGSGGSCDCAIVNLPVELTKFDAECVGGNAKVHWQTASEVNNDYFLIEKMSGINVFHEVGRVKGSGNSNSLLDYLFVDDHMIQGENYYRLTQVDYDGKTTIYNTISLNCNENYKGQPIMEAYPNPFENEVNIVIKNIADGDFTLQLVDNLGRVVFSEKHTATESVFQTKLSLATLRSAVYNLRCVTKGDVLNSRVVKR